MTKNEKAATYIGWKPDQECYALDNEGWCAVHNLTEPNQRTHFIPAPDMSRPDNYMRAVETVIASGAGWFEFGKDRDGYYVHFFSAADTGFGFDAENGLGLPIVRTLAALYDAEHKI